MIAVALEGLLPLLKASLRWESVDSCTQSRKQLGGTKQGAPDNRDSSMAGHG